MSVFKLVSGNACHYVRATSRAAALVRAYKAWGMHSPTVYDIGQHSPDIGAHGYTTACHTLDVYRETNPAEQAPRVTIPSKKETGRINDKGLALARFLGLT